MIITNNTLPISILKQKALLWANQTSDVCCYLDSNNYASDKNGRYECLLAVGVEQELQVDIAGNGFEQLRNFASQYPSWLFGHLSYDLKNEVENLNSNNEDNLKFPDLYFFVPTYLLIINKDASIELLSQKEATATVWKAILGMPILEKEETPKVQLQQKISQADYLDKIRQIKQHIVDGDTYELNFCQEFFAEQVVLDPLPLFERMNAIAKAPFATYYKKNDQYLLCGSPERFMCKKGTKITSQPIKGTIRRGETVVEDEELKTQLSQSTKDKAENVMIVDLVRNDLTKTCKTASIQVEELFGIYGFERVFQMISTISGELQDNKDWIDVIQEAFPMGSMTGAPKVISMQLIEDYEQTKRGLYAGAIGYVSPERDFDFNVVIRSLFYNATQQYLSFQVGGAIVYDSEPLAEYEECLLKSKTMLEALENAF